MLPGACPWGSLRRGRIPTSEVSCDATAGPASAGPVRFFGLCDAGGIGSGQMGGAVGLRWAEAGHEILFSSRNPDELTGLVREAGPPGSRRHRYTSEHLRLPSCGRLSVFRKEKSGSHYQLPGV